MARDLLPVDSAVIWNPNNDPERTAAQARGAEAVANDIAPSEIADQREWLTTNKPRELTARERDFPGAVNGSDWTAAGHFGGKGARKL